MFDFGDELTIESYRIPWLIWIQILVLLLLMLLLYGFTLFALDLPESSSSSSSSSSSPDSQLGKIQVFKQTTTLASPCFQASQVGEKQSIKGEIGIAKGTSRRIVVRGGEDQESVEMEESSTKEANQNWYHHHPCHYLRLAKLAFLKCFGLDLLSPDNSSVTDQRNQR